MFKHLLFIVLMCGGVYYYWTTRPVEHDPGVLVPESPKQETVYDREKIDFKDFTLTPKAKISFKARILSVENYYFDQYSGLTQTDAVFGWGPMSDSKNLNQLLVDQYDRTFDWQMGNPPLKLHKMRVHTANMHLIGSTQQVRDKIGRFRKGHIVKISGYLVDAKSADGWTLKTSLSREDSGDNSSELIWINKLSIL